ncbi:MAG: tryptophan--tRNA ligase, partial [Bdellovibrionota bacterium]
IACGLDPEKCTLFVQSHVPEHAELAWVLNCYAYMGELGRMTQYKDKSTKAGENIPVGIFTYPALMAADILLYHTNLVPVGQDQKQHVELTRDLAIRMNNLYGKDLFTVPQPFIPPLGAKIMSLQNPEAKMSKSDPDPNSAVYLNDTDDQIRKKIKRAITDSGSEITYEESKPGVKNLLDIQSVLTGKSTEALVASYAGKQYGHLKVDTGEIVVSKLGPVRDKADELFKDPGYLDSVLKRGALRARERAAKTLALVYDRVGLIPR